MFFDINKQSWFIKIRGWVEYQDTEVTDKNNPPKALVEDLVLLAHNVTHEEDYSMKTATPVQHVDPINGRTMTVKSVCKPTRSLLEGAPYHRGPTILGVNSPKSDKK